MPCNAGHVCADGQNIGSLGPQFGVSCLLFEATLFTAALQAHYTGLQHGLMFQSC